MGEVTPLYGRLRAVVSDAYYNARNAARTMEQAADAAAHDCERVVKDWLTDHAVDMAQHAACRSCGHAPHNGSDCGEVTGYDHLNGDHECGCPGELDATDIIAGALADHQQMFEPDDLPTEFHGYANAVLNALGKHGWRVLPPETGSHPCGDPTCTENHGESEHD